MKKRKNEKDKNPNNPIRKWAKDKTRHFTEVRYTYDK